MTSLFFNTKTSTTDDDVHSRTFKILFVIMASAFNSVHVYKSIRRFNFYAFVSSQNHKPLSQPFYFFNTGIHMKICISNLVRAF